MSVGGGGGSERRGGDISLGRVVTGADRTSLCEASPTFGHENANFSVLQMQMIMI